MQLFELTFDSYMRHMWIIYNIQIDFHYLPLPVFNGNVHPVQIIAVFNIYMITSMHYCLYSIDIFSWLGGTKDPTHTYSKQRMEILIYRPHNKFAV